ncbi:energy transducer TonB [Tsuneonella sp. HG249]
MAANDNFASTSRRPKPGTLALIVLLHALAIYSLAKVFAPQMTASIQQSVLSSITVTVETKQYTPPPESEPDSGAEGEEGKKAIPKAFVAPETKLVSKPNPPAPKVSSTGSADTSGAREAGSGTGAGGAGNGTGSGAGGGGAGGGIATNPVHISGAINNARDYPVPADGRDARIGSEVIVKVTVSPEGRASNCSVFRPSRDPEADRITCRLVVERLRFRPATDSAGNPVSAPFYWRQRWF